MNMIDKELAMQKDICLDQRLPYSYNMVSAQWRYLSAEFEFEASSAYLDPAR